MLRSRVQAVCKSKPDPNFTSLTTLCRLSRLVLCDGAAHDVLHPQDVANVGLNVFLPT